MGFFDGIKDAISQTYPITLKVYSNGGNNYYFNFAKIKYEGGEPIYFLFKERDVVPYVDLSNSIIFNNDRKRQEFEVTMPTSNEIIPIDRRREKVSSLIADLNVSLGSQAKDEQGNTYILPNQKLLTDSLKELECFGDKTIWMTAAVPALARVGVWNALKAKNNYFNKSLMEKYFALLVAALAIIGMVIVVWMSLNFAGDQATKIGLQVAQQTPALVKAVAEAMGRTPPA